MTILVTDLSNSYVDLKRGVLENTNSFFGINFNQRFIINFLFGLLLRQNIR